MKVAVFGGTGFVGSYLIDELIASDHIPRVLVRTCLLYTSDAADEEDV